MNTPLSYSVTRWKDGGWQHIDDAVSPEEPVYVSWSGSSCRLWAWLPMTWRTSPPLRAAPRMPGGALPASRRMLRVKAHR